MKIGKGDFITKTDKKTGRGMVIDLGRKEESGYGDTMGVCNEGGEESSKKGKQGGRWVCGSYKESKKEIKTGVVVVLGLTNGKKEDRERGRFVRE